MKTYRPERVSDLIIEELNNLILREIEVPGALITITDVEVAKDLSRALVKISVIPSGKSKEVLKVLESKRKHFQYLLIRKMNIRPMPQIFFKIDLGPEKAAIVEKRLLEEK
jgi:ribosome-binding factor A